MHKSFHWKIDGAWCGFLHFVYTALVWLTFISGRCRNFFRSACIYVFVKDVSLSVAKRWQEFKADFSKGNICNGDVIVAILVSGILLLVVALAAVAFAIYRVLVFSDWSMAVAVAIIGLCYFFWDLHIERRERAEKRLAEKLEIS
ncbi:MAG: hypothetical protein WC461_02160 [Candidatus Paceibacterota bacterium]